MDGVIANSLRMLFCVFLGVYLGAEWFAWICGYGLSVSTVVVCVLALLVVLCYTIWDIGVLKEKYDFEKLKNTSLSESNARCQN